MDDPDLNDPVVLQWMIDFVHWMMVVTRLQAKGVVLNVPVVTGNVATILQIMQQAAIWGVSPRKDKATIRRVIVVAAQYSGKESPPREKVEELIIVLQHHSEDR